MLVRYKIHYNTRWGENLQVVLHDADHTIVPMRHIGMGWWESEACVAVSADYNYRVVLAGAVSRVEAHAHVMPEVDVPSLMIVDRWYDAPEGEVSISAWQWLANARPEVPAVGVVMAVFAPQLPPHWSLALCGNLPPVGSWNPRKSLIMTRLGDTLWMLPIPIEPNMSITVEFKFIVVDNHGGEVIGWESGENRCMTFTAGDYLTIVNCETRAFPGSVQTPVSEVVVPIYALRTAADAGCGDIGDLRKLIDWARRVHHSMLEIQGLSHSVACDVGDDCEQAIDPCYLDLAQMPQPEDADKRRLMKAQFMQLNTSPTPLLEQVRALKIEWARLSLLSAEGQAIARSRAFKRFVRREAGWLPAYSTRLALRGRTLAAYMQYLLREQLRAVVEYGIKHDVMVALSTARLEPFAPVRMERSLEEHLASRLPRLDL